MARCKSYPRRCLLTRSPPDGDAWAGFQCSQGGVRLGLPGEQEGLGVGPLRRCGTARVPPGVSYCLRELFPPVGCGGRGTSTVACFLEATRVWMSCYPAGALAICLPSFWSFACCGLSQARPIERKPPRHLAARPDGVCMGRSGGILGHIEGTLAQTPSSIQEASACSAEEVGATLIFETLSCTQRGRESFGATQAFQDQGSGSGASPDATHEIEPNRN